MSVFDLMGKSQNVEICEEDYGYEIGGDMAAFEEAFSELADLREMFADKNAEGVKAIHESMQSGVTMESAVEEFRQSAVMEGFLGSVKERILKMLKALKAKIVAFFKSALRYFNNLWMNNKKFVEKYGEEAKKKNLEGFEVDMFAYKTSEFDPKAVMDSSVTNAIKQSAENDGKEAKANIIKAMAAKLGVGDARDNQDIQKKLGVKLRGGTQKHGVPINASKLDEFIKAITDGGEVDACKEASDAFEKAIDEFSSEVEKAQDTNSSDKEKNDSDKDNMSKKLSEEATCFTEAKNIGMAAFKTFTSVVNERNSAYRACVAKALHFSAKK